MSLMGGFVYRESGLNVWKEFNYSNMTTCVVHVAVHGVNCVYRSFPIVRLFSCLYAYIPANAVERDQFEDVIKNQIRPIQMDN